MSPSTAARILLAAGGIAALASQAPAQTPSETASPGAAPTEVDQVIVTGVPYGVTQRATTIATDVLDEEALATAPASSLGDLLNGRPGLRSTSFAPGSSRPVIRGLSGPRVQVLTNGIGQIDASSVSPDHQVATDPAEANRIEIIRGPATLVYGGSAIGGVVNIIDDRIPTAIPDNGVSGVLSGQLSSVDAGRGGFGRVTAGAGNLAINIDAVRRRTDDYDIPSSAISRVLAEAEGIAREDTGGVQPNSWTDLVTWGAGASLVGEAGYLGASYKDTDSEYGTVAEDEVFIKLRQKRIDVRGEHRFSEGLLDAVRGSFGKADYTHTEYERPGEPGTQFRSEGQEGRVDLVMRKRGSWSGAFGVQALKRDFEAIGEEAFLPTTKIDEGGLYTVQRYDTGNLGFEGGLRYDRRTLRAVPFGATSELKRAFDNWSASGAVFVRPVAGLFLGLSLSRTQRAPSEVELFANGLHIATAAFEVGDATFGKETVTTLEGTVHYDRGRFAGDLHVFRAEYDGFIDEVQTGADFYFAEEDEFFPIYQFVQGDARFYGFEAEASYAVWRNGDRQLSLEAGVDYVHAKTDHGPAARIPPYSATGRVAYSSSLLDASVEVRHVGQQGRLASFELPTKAYTLLNISAAVRPFRDKRLTIFAEGRNLTDEEAREHASFLKDIALQPARNFRLGVAYRF
ncbi:TonB-dependent receptor [uncultured Phenylobacterium sp.]|uniref:TonB-dependent receptor n=1 Tax=uncultured Phenylobacterium sp. TaxID=349273 RepID=UPI0025FE0BDF|nr:TonB-dependent receptor [uncultured Phenylobacterium sp.]